MTAFTYEVGDLYVFSDGQKPDRIFGIFEGVDDTGNILLETATTDFIVFHRHVVLPESYCHAKPASRNELRDFAYNMGYRRI